MKAIDYKDIDGKARGLNLTSVWNYLKFKRGNMGVDELALVIKKKYPSIPKPADLKEKDWYPLYYEFLLNEECCNFLGDDSNKFSYEIGKYSAENIGILKFFVKLTMSPNSLAKKASKDWRQYYNCGTLDVVINKTGYIELDLVDFPYYELYSHNLHGFFNGVVKISGTKNFKVENPEGYKYILTW